uniref:asparagine synthase (glutamine-hydrolyzing) n=2 Tax=Nonomuraea gerenzanensis TaxID=93944 RepID=A0A1M4EM42_9ACTN|nr:Asparagine synthetase [glutamine-hydrolyzing] [Nonomuraea gerenzanensis]
MSGGLVGWIDHERDLTQHMDTIRAMSDTLAARAPDGGALHLTRHAALAHRHLALPSTPQSPQSPQSPQRPQGPRGPLGQLGPQPALFPTQQGDGVALAYDGAIYNLAALRRGLGLSPLATDTDVLLHAYLTHGADFVTSLIGAFALAIWDGRDRRLLLARDHLGLKPLYYHPYPGGILFASLPGGIMANPLFTPRLDRSLMTMVLQPRLTLAGETPLEGLREVEPAHVLTYTPDRGPHSRAYWRLVSEPHEDPPARTAERVRELFDAAVAGQLPASGPCGAMLSGGVDSTSVAALAARLLPGKLDTYCVEFDSDRAHFAPTELRPDVDAPFAAAAAQFMGSRHTTLTATMRDLLAAIPATRRARDLPGWGQFDASMYLLFRRMREDTTVALSGEAADEFFGGYPYLFKPELIGRDTFPWLGDGPKLADYLVPELAREGDEKARYAQLLGEVPRLPGERGLDARMREVLYLGMAGPLAVVLDRKERMSAAQGLHVRLPFCDHRLVQYVWNVPWSMKCGGGLKSLLKDAMAGLLPPSTLNRRKSAYPHVQNPAHDQALVREARWIANASESPLRPMFDAPRLNGLLDRIGAGELRAQLPGGSSGAQLLVNLVELNAWVREYRVSIS